MRKNSFELWLVWQNVETRQRYHVGRLLYEDNIYKFRYENQGYRRKLQEALDSGYRPHLAFPDTNKVYTSTKLFGPFARRLPDPRRPDYRNVLKSLGLSVRDNEMEVLHATGGVLATDSYEFVSPIVVEGNHFYLDFFVAGWRYYDGDSVINQLRIGEQVELCLDPENPEDHKAVQITTMNGDVLGYIPAFYRGWMFEIIEKNSNFKVAINKIHSQAVPHRKVNITITGEVNQFVNIDEVLNDEEQLRLVMC